MCFSFLCLANCLLGNRCSVFTTLFTCLEGKNFFEFFLQISNLQNFFYLWLVLSVQKTTTRTRCLRSQRLRRHGQDYADTFWKLLKFLTEFKGTIRRKKGFKCFYTPNSNNLNIWKPLNLTKKLCVRVAVDYVDTRFSNFVIEYLRANEKNCKTVCACSYGA